MAEKKRIDDIMKWQKREIKIKEAQEKKAKMRRDLTVKNRRMEKEKSEKVLKFQELKEQRLRESRGRHTLSTASMHDSKMARTMTEGFSHRTPKQEPNEAEIEATLQKIA